MIFENLIKPFFKNDNTKTTPSIPSNDKNIDKTLSTTDLDFEKYTLGYFDDNSGSLFNRKDNSTLINKQNDLIKRYRKAAMVPEVGAGIEEIINELAFVPNNDSIVSLDISDKLEANDKLKEAFINNFEEVINLMNFTYNADSILKQYYIDGQIRFGCSYNTKGTQGIKSGITAIHILTPLNLFYHSEAKKWKYYTQQNQNAGFMGGETKETEGELILSDEELVTIDSGLYSEGMIISHLHSVLKLTNQLSSLEDMLIPLRFSRSVSRRVFNIDVGDLPYAKAMQAVKETQDKFKYKKYYDVEHGTITNSASIASIVEDYYFPSRGGKGTSVDVLDESGNLGEIKDIEYIQQKLYSALKVPLGRLAGSDKGTSYDYSGTQIEQDEIRFFAFINRIRQRFNLGLIDILKRHMVAKGLVSLQEFNDYAPYLVVKWERESNFLERQQIDLMKSKLDLYAQVKDFIGEIYSKTWVFKNVLKMTEEEILIMKKEMEMEELGQLALTQPNIDGDTVADTTDIDDTDSTDNTDDDTNVTSGGDKKPNSKPEDIKDTEVDKPQQPQPDEDVPSHEFGGTFGSPNK
jgi:hypothetical protein